VDYQLEALYLTRLDAEIIGLVSRGSFDEATKAAANNGWREELEAKLTSLHLPFPWDKRGIK
jgi:hypothetical protein